ncbi:MAG: sodium:calcium antiporter, partial [Gammaproteobacteria bacterium]
LILFVDDTLSRLDGAILLLGLVGFLYWMVRLGIRTSGSDPMAAEYAAEIREDLSMRSAVLWLVVGFAILIVGSEILVAGATSLARHMGISELIIGLSIVAVGTSLPELAVSVNCAYKGEAGLALGNIIGSNIFNLLAVIGVAGVIHPADLDPEVLRLHFPVMIGFTAALFFIAYNYSGRARISRLEGVVLLGGFFSYHAYLAIQNL